jgi:hypothetical protein
MQKTCSAKKAKAGFWCIALAVYALQAESKRRVFIILLLEINSIAKLVIANYLNFIMKRHN